MSVNLPRPDRVIITIAILGVALSTLAWSGDIRPTSASKPGLDTIPAGHAGHGRTKAKRAPKKEEGRVARELDLRLDMEEPEELSRELMMDLPVDLNIDMDANLDANIDLDTDIKLDMEGLKGLNARIEADVLKNTDAWKDQELFDLSALDELKSIEIDDEALQMLKDMNIDEDLWNELRELKIEMDDLKEDIDTDLSRYYNDPRIRAEVERVMEAVKEEIPRVRKEVEKAMQSSPNGGKQWQ